MTFFRTHPDGGIEISQEKDGPWTRPEPERPEPERAAMPSFIVTLAGGYDESVTASFWDIHPSGALIFYGSDGRQVGAYGPAWWREVGPEVPA